MGRKLGTGCLLAAVTTLVACEERIVEPAAVAQVRIEPDALTLRVGARSRFDAVVYDAEGNTLTGRDIAWAVGNVDVAAIAPDGTVSATGVGQTQVFARSGPFEGVATLRVTSAVVASVLVEPAEATIRLGAASPLRVSVRATDGTEIDDRPATWSSSAPTVATVDAAGVVRGIGLGRATITAEVDGVSGTATATVVAPALSALVVQPAAPALRVGGSIRLTATGRDEAGQPVTGLPVTWSSGAPAVASVDDAGLVTARAVGSARIEAAFGGMVGAVAVTVSPVPAASIRVTPDSGTIPVGDTLRLGATVRDSAGNELRRSPAWTSSDAAVATVDGQGLVRGVAPGTVWVAAAIDGVRDSARVRITERPVSTVVVVPPQVTLRPDSTFRFTARAFAQDGSSLTRDITWSTSDPQVASVDATGLVTAHEPGTTAVRATAEGVTGTATVTVDALTPITSIIVRPATLDLEDGETAPLAAVGVREDGREVEDIAVTWSSGDTAVATVDTAGTVTGVGSGTTEVTAQYQNLAGSATVTVTSTVPARVTIDADPFSLEVGTTRQLSATVENDVGDPLTVPVAWSVLDGSIAAVDDDGRVEALSVGTTYVVAAVGTLRDSVRVTVTAVPAARVVVQPALATIGEEETVTLQATVYDADDNVLDRPVVWSTNQNSIVNVAQDGRVTGKKTGVAIVTATVDGQSDSATIIVAGLESPDGPGPD